ncbi:hypothetical protein PSAB6_30186 [Paraburkholderia sabiae]|nr:hypothetical protein PSAB6_30186 [Paraburkholderia sabiae]
MFFVCLPSRLPRYVLQPACGFSRRARLTAGFLQSADAAARQLNCGTRQRYLGRHRRFKSGFLLPTFLCRCKEK